MFIYQYLNLQFLLYKFYNNKLDLKSNFSHMDDKNRYYTIIITILHSETINFLTNFTNI